VDQLNPPTKVIERFLRAWKDRETHRTEYTMTSLSVDEQNPADITLTLSRRLMAVVKVKSLLHVEAGLEMIALAMAISSEASCVETLFFKKSELRRPIRTTGCFQKWLLM
jgi:hypothetical protein